MDDAQLLYLDDSLTGGDLTAVEPCFELSAEAIAYLATHTLAAAPADPEGSV